MECFTRLVTVTIGSSGAVLRSTPDCGGGPKFGVGPIEIARQGERARASVPLLITHAGALDPDQLSIDAAAYADPGAGHLDFLALQNATLAWKSPPQKSQRDGTCTLVIETDFPEQAAGLCIRVSYANAEQFRVLQALPVESRP